MNGYPTQEIVEHDISQGHCMVVCKQKAIVGTFAFIEGRDPTYDVIEDGAWADDERPYATLHRIACAPDQHGIFDACIEWSRRHATSLRIDTHADNQIMLHLVPKRGFSRCGIIHVADGTPREAFQMLNTGTLCIPLQDYIGDSIIPRYDYFDAAHQRDHVQSVIDASMALARHYEVDVNMVYTIAAYHDLGLSEGRERHHIVSGEILRGDKELLRWFSKQQLEVMAQAAEDHRASAGHTPRSIYGLIIAEADRDIRPLEIVRRTVQYGLSHFPDLSKEEHWQRVCEHLDEKYSSHGYLRLFLPESPNADNLTQLRQIIDDRARLRTLFDKYYSELQKNI